MAQYHDLGITILAYNLVAGNSSWYGCLYVYLATVATLQQPGIALRYILIPVYLMAFLCSLEHHKLIMQVLWVAIPIMVVLRLGVVSPIIISLLPVQ